MTSWSQIYLGGAQRVVDRTTYEILVLGVLLAGLPGVAVLVLFRHMPGGLLVGALVAGGWAWIVRIGVAGALTTAANHGGELARTPAIVRATLARMPTLIGVSLLLLLAEVAVAVALGMVGLIGFAGLGAAPILGLLTPLFLLVGGVGLVVAVMVRRLSFASVVADSSNAGTAIRNGWALLRSQKSSAVVWVAGEFALVLGLSFAVVVPILTGAAYASSIQTAWILRSLDGAGLTSVTVAFAFWVMSAGLFVLLTFGGLWSFTVGSALAFYQSGSELTASLRLSPGRPTFCDECGRPQPSDAPFCDSCGRRLISSGTAGTEVLRAR